MGGRVGKAVKYMGTEGDRTLGDEHTVQYAEDAL